MDLSIIIVNWNTRELLKECLAAVYQTITGITFEVIVVDNGSQDASQQMVQNHFPQVILIENTENAGFARANNQGIRKSTGEFILLLNSDAFLSEQAVARMLTALKQHPRIGILGPHLFYPDGRHQHSHEPLPGIGQEIVKLTGLDRISASSSGPQQSIIITGMVTGACLMFRRALADQIGLLDESFFFFGEEVDYCYRATKAGWQVAYLPEVPVVHIQGGTTGQTAQRIVQLYRAKVHYFAKHQGRSASRSLLLAMQGISRLKASIFQALGLLRPSYQERSQLWQSVANQISKVPLE